MSNDASRADRGNQELATSGAVHGASRVGQAAGAVPIGGRLLLVAAVVVLAGVASAQTMDGPPGPCQEAAVWHLHQALRFSQAEDQGFHLGAAQAAQLLGGLGDDCQGWRDDAARPVVAMDGKATDGSAEATDGAQAAAVSK